MKRFNNELLTNLCEFVADGGFTIDWLEINELSRAQLCTFLANNPEADALYRVAEERRAESRLEIADKQIDRAATKEDILKAKIRMDSACWRASRILRKRYGDKQEVEMTGKDGGPMVISWGARPAPKALE